MEKPTIRAVDAFPVEVDGKRLICIRDPLDVASQPLVVAHPAFFIMSLCDGLHSLTEIEKAFQERYGQPLERDQLTQLLTQLDELYYLESERFSRRWQELLTEFRASPVRIPAHAGISYPADEGELRQEMAGFFSEAEDARPLPPSDSPVRGIIAPHIDLRVGGKTYAQAYRALSERADADLFVIFGTSHQPGSQLFTATYKDFATPLGKVATNQGLVRQLEERCGNSILADEILHRTEHSVEFQVLFLKYALANGRQFEVVPILVSSFHEMLWKKKLPIEDEKVSSFIDGLTEAIRQSGRRHCLVAGVDFAHIGQKFGDVEGLSSSLLERSERRDRELIAALEEADSKRFFTLAASDNDSTRVCGLSAMYTFLEVAKRTGMTRGHLLRYDRSREHGTQSSVSFASLAFC